MTHVCIASHHPALTTSYGRVTAKLVDGLVAAGIRVTVVASISENVSRYTSSDVNIIPTSLEAIAGAAAQTAQSTNAKLLITLGDPWMFESLARSDHRPRCRWMACFPMDGGPVPKSWESWISAADDLVVFSRFAQQLVTSAVNREPDFIPHGVDTACFSPTDKPAAKRKLIGDDSRYIVGCVAANQQRKNLPALLRAFARFCRNKPDALLYLHTPIIGFWDIEELTDRYGITAQTRATLNYNPQRGVADETMAIIYNAFDLFALPTMGEGFGLPLLEAAAAGVPTIVTDCSSCPELLVDSRQRIRVSGTLTMDRGIDQAVIDEDDLVLRLEQCYADPVLRADISERGRQMSLPLDWSIVTRKLVERVFASLS